ncbi:PREDICTED: cytochrome P450 6B1-like [Papilio polytes]|uniref:cytochrome P450 6B1-like n=1 Tax=Papilio polytes TaxID=76194 RepID=UPI00067633EF|nr:PREDICTED: cytochrome P450 6B1-like [Papilio polytes]
MAYVILSVAAALFVALYYYFTRTFNYWKERNVVGPKPLPFVGNLKDSFFRKKTVIMVYKEIYDKFPKEKVVGMYRMTTPCLLIRDLDIVKNILIKDFDLFLDRGVEFSDEGLGVNLFHADGDRWRVLRNRFTPLFTSGKLKNMLRLMSECGDKFVNYVGDVTQNNMEHRINLLVQRFTMASISACAFGLDLDKDMLKSLQDLDKLVFTVNYSIELDMMYPGILKKLNGSLFPKSVSKFFDDLTKSVIQRRGGMPTNRKDFMDLILELRQRRKIEASKRNDDEDVKVLELTDGIIAAQAFIFYTAGYETSAATIAFMLYELAMNSNIQDKLIEEIDVVLKRHNGEITYECLSDMPYLGQTFDETLRKYPVADLLFRNAQVDYPIPGTDVTVKKGQTVIISGWGIQHDPKYYPNPDKFDPERFSPENEKNRHSCAYLPFGAGPRNCLGMRFAKWQSQVCIVKFLSNFRVEPSKNTPVDLKYDPSRLFLLPSGGINLNVVRRQSKRTKNKPYSLSK